MQCTSKEKPDDKALLYVNQNLFDNAANALSEKLCDYTEDYNGNGEVLYRVNNVSYNGNNLAGVNYSVANSGKLLSAVATAEYVLFIVDEHGYDYLSDSSVEVFESYDFMPDKTARRGIGRGALFRPHLPTADFPKIFIFA